MTQTSRCSDPQPPPNHQSTLNHSHHLPDQWRLRLSAVVDLEPELDGPLAPRRVRRFAVPLDAIPVDFFADPDGVWDYDTLGRAAGFDPDQSGVAIGALTQHYAGFPEGAAVVTLNAQDRPYVAIIECAEPQIGRVLQDQVA